MPALPDHAASARRGDHPRGGHRRGPADERANGHARELAGEHGAERTDARSGRSDRSQRDRRGLVVRSLAVATGLLLLLGLLASRLVRIQVTQAAEWKARADRQQNPIREVPAYRGDVLTRDGVVLARSVACRSAFAEPRRLGQRVKVGRTIQVLPPTAEDYRDAARRIARALGYGPREENELRERLMDDDRQAFCFIERRLPDERAERLAAADVTGIGFQSEYRRAYPRGALAAQLLGFTEVTGDGELTGRTGIEQALELYLRGSPGRREVVRDGRRRDLLTEGNLLLAPEDGASVTLTIDSRLQEIVERAAARTAELWKPEGIAVVCLEPSTGRVLALASWPAFDPNAIGDLAPGQFERVIRNRPLMDSFEPGSTVKGFVLGAALDGGAVTKDQRIDCHGPFRVGNKNVTDVHPHGVMSLVEYLTVSSNVGSVKVGLALGPEGLHDALVRAGFGAPTGLGLRPEERGLLPVLEQWKVHTTRSVCQGYALMVTPIQLASAFAAFGAGGARYAPQLIEEIRDAEGRLVQGFEPRPAGRVVSEAMCAEVLLPALTRVVEEGTAKTVRLSRWSAAGKTGTTMKIEGGSYTNRYVSSFVGFAPAEAPRLLVLAMVDDPRSPDGRRAYGGTVAGPLVKEVFEEALPYLRVPPSPGREAPADATGTR